MKLDGLNMLKALSAQGSDPADLKNEQSVEAAQQFESYLVEMMIREMRKTLPKGGIFDSELMSTFNSMFDKAMADDIAQGEGMGFTEALLRSWGIEEETSRQVIQARRAHFHEMHDHDHDHDVPTLAGQFPVKGRLTSRFGRRRHPITGKHSHHKGIDIAAPTGTDIQPIKGGVVTIAGNRGGFGKVVVIDHGDGWTSTYAHCSKLNVKTGQHVSADEIIAQVGSTGLSTGPHLHFEVHHQGKALDPQRVFNWDLGSDFSKKEH